jgi:hypothetical protein
MHQINTAYALSEDAKAQLSGLQAVDRRIDALQAELAMLKIARNAYALGFIKRP